MRRTCAWGVAAVSAIALAGVLGCSLINLDAFDAAPDASSPGDEIGAPDAPGEATSGDDSSDAANVATDDSTDETGDDTAQSGDDASDATQVDALDAMAMMESTTEGAASDGGDSAPPDAAAEAGDTHKCGASVLAAKAAVASSFQPASAGNVALPANLAIDGDFTTRWGSALQVDPSWIYVDFGAPVFVGEVDILWQNACAVNFDIDISSDAKTWNVMKSITGNAVGDAIPPTAGWTAAQALHYSGLSGRGRYVRVNGTSRCLAMYGYSIWEVRALGDADSTCVP
jgi:hypothetical protein